MLAASDDLLQQLLWPAVIAAAGCLVLAMTWRRRPHRQRRPADREQVRERFEQRANVRDDMNSLLVELEEFARAMNAQIETKSAKLEVLIRQADQRAERLEALLKADSHPTADAKPPEDPRHRQIYELADAGRSAQQIAQTLKRNIGEIELILALRPAAMDGAARSAKGQPPTGEKDGGPGGARGPA